MPGFQSVGGDQGETSWASDVYYIGHCVDETTKGTKWFRAKSRGGF